MIYRIMLKYTKISLFLIIVLFLSSCKDTVIKVPYESKIYKIGNDVKININGKIFPKDGYLMGFSISKQYIYGWYRNINKNIYFLIDLKNGKINEGDFGEMKKLLSKSNHRYPIIFQNQPFLKSFELKIKLF